MNAPEFKLEPRTIGGLLDATFRIYGRDFLLLLGIFAVAQVPIDLIMVAGIAYGHAQGGDSGQLTISLVQLGTALLSLVVAFPLSTGAITFAVSERYLGRTLTVADAYRMALPRWTAILNATISVGLWVMLGLLLLIVPGIVWALTYMVVTESLLLEKLTAAEAMRRSKHLTHGHRRNILNVMFVIYVILFVMQFGAGSLVGMFAGSDPSAADMGHQIAQSLVSLLITPLLIVAAVLIYYDLRIKKEGFDLERLGQSLSADTSNPAPPPLP